MFVFLLSFKLENGKALDEFTILDKNSEIF